MSDGFEVDLTALDQAVVGIARTMRDMQTIAVEEISGDVDQYGHGGLHEAFEHFCERWQYGVSVLIEDGSKIVTALNASMDSYIDGDSSAAESMRAVGTDTDPAAEVAGG